MKKIAMVTCLIAGCSYGMNFPKELDAASGGSSKIICDIKNAGSSDESMHSAREEPNASEPVSDVQTIKGLDRAVKIDVANSDLIGQWQDITEVFSDDETDDNVFETSASTYKEGRFWTIVRKVFQPLQITTSASTMVLITASEAVKSTHPSVSTGLSYGALGSAVTSGVLSLFIAKMNSKINQLNKRYKAKLAAEGRDIDVGQEG
ncbi:MAG: hypothetical protein J5821_01215 [Alphaproteobacteria bacterium]|nr:hypothetical protein [Alphaproteobacteria bacterium]